MERRPRSPRVARAGDRPKEMPEETVYQPQQKLDEAAGRAVFEASCGSCHRFGSIGTDHAIAGRT